MEDTLKAILLPFLNNVRDAMMQHNVVGGALEPDILTYIKGKDSEKHKDITADELSEWLFKWRKEKIIQSHERPGVGEVWHGCYPMSYLVKFLAADMEKAKVNPEHVASVAMLLEGSRIVPPDQEK